MVVLEFEKLEKAVFVERVNKFLGKVELRGKTLEVHVHDPGRLWELLYRGNEVLIEYVEGTRRKTSFDLIAARKGKEYIFVHSGYHSEIARKMLNSRIIPLHAPGNIRSEIKHGKSRVDFLVEGGNGNRIWIEVKGCTLSVDGKALFPDAPTKRGKRHLEELMKLVEEGDDALLVILVFARSSCFAPNILVDPEFTDTFWKAIDKGVKVLPLSFSFRDGKLIYEGTIPLCTGGGGKC